MLDPTQEPGSASKPLDQNVVSFVEKKKIATVEDLKNAQLTRQPSTYSGLNSDDVTKNTGFNDTPLAGGGGTTTIIIKEPDGGGDGGGGVSGAAGFGDFYADPSTGTVGTISYGGRTLYALNASGVFANPGSYYPNSLFLFAYGTTDSAFVIRLGS